MITYQKLAGSTDVSVVIRIIDSTDGTPETGVVFNTSGIDMEYRREGAASTDITEATLAALTAAHSDGGFLHIGNGYYRLDLPDAAVASGSAGVLVHGTVTGMVVIGCYIDLTPAPVDLRTWLGSAPNALVSSRVDASTGAMASGVLTAAAIAADAITDAKVASDVTIASVTGAVGSVTGLTNATIADAVLDEDMTAHQTQGSLGQAIGDPAADTDTIWGLVNTNLDAAVSSRVTPAQVNSEADTALSDVGLTTTVTGRIDAAVTTRATPAQVNTEVLDVMTVDTFAELAAVPAATSTLKDKINWLFALARNRLTQTASTQTLRNDANSADIATAAVADDGTTASRGEWV